MLAGHREDHLSYKCKTYSAVSNLQRLTRKAWGNKQSLKVNLKSLRKTKNASKPKI